MFSSIHTHDPNKLWFSHFIRFFFYFFLHFTIYRTLSFSLARKCEYSHFYFQIFILAQITHYNHFLNKFEKIYFLFCSKFLSLSLAFHLFFLTEKLKSLRISTVFDKQFTYNSNKNRIWMLSEFIVKKFLKLRTRVHCTQKWTARPFASSITTKLNFAIAIQYNVWLSAVFISLLFLSCLLLLLFYSFPFIFAPLAGWYIYYIEPYVEYIPNERNKVNAPKTKTTHTKNKSEKDGEKRHAFARIWAF